MKSEIIEQPTNVFNPIKVMFTIESQEELDALIMAREALRREEIADGYDLDTRCYWIEALETLAGGL